MRLFWFWVLSAVLVSGCARHKTVAPSGSSAFPPPGARTVPPALQTNGVGREVLVTPGGVVSGRVSSVNPNARFVIATFPLGTMPQNGQRLGVYRNGFKVGEIKITGPQRDVNIVADITAGECRIGDEIKPD